MESAHALPLKLASNFLLTSSYFAPALIKATPSIKPSDPSEVRMQVRASAWASEPPQTYETEPAVPSRASVQHIPGPRGKARARRRGASGRVGLRAGLLLNK